MLPDGRGRPGGADGEGGAASIGEQQGPGESRTLGDGGGVHSELVQVVTICTELKTISLADKVHI